MARQRAKHLRYELDQDLAKAKQDETVFIEDLRRSHSDMMIEVAHERNELEAKNLEERQAYEQDTKEIMAVSSVFLKSLAMNFYAS